MRYVKPHFYDEFCCIADKCPDTCCAGWQIMIDEDSLDRYENVEGEFGDRLYASVDWKEGCFRQSRGRCAFLNSDNLCDLYTVLGEGALCRTCTMYPRHVEEFEGLRELSLSLSCPVAARMMLECEENVRFLEKETDEEEELEDEFEEFDLLLFTQLEDARSVILGILQDRTLDMRRRIRLVTALAKEMQQCIDEERYFDVDEVVEKFRKIHEEEQGTKSAGDTAEPCYDRMCREYQVLCSLERLREEWTQVLENAKKVLYDGGPEAYDDICRRFSQEYGYESADGGRWVRMTEQLMVFFVFTYFCGAVYDDWIYSKMGLAVFSVRWIQELIMARWAANGGSVSWDECVELSYRYAREIEHSDENLNRLEEWLQEDREQSEAW